MNNFRPINRDMGYLLPPSVDDWLPERHLARFVVEVIDGLGLSAMSQSYRGSGSASYHPVLLVSLLGGTSVILTEVEGSGRALDDNEASVAPRS